MAGLLPSPSHLLHYNNITYLAGPKPQRVGGLAAGPPAQVELPWGSYSNILNLSAPYLQLTVTSFPPQFFLGGGSTEGMRQFHRPYYYTQTDKYTVKFKNYTYLSNSHAGTGAPVIQRFTLQSKNIVYCITRQTCGLLYMGEDRPHASHPPQPAPARVGGGQTGHAPSYALPQPSAPKPHHRWSSELSDLDGRPTKKTREDVD